MIANILDILSLLLLVSIIPAVWLVYKKKIKFLSGVFIGTFLFLLSFCISVYVTKLLYGINPIDYMVNTAADSFVKAFQSVPDVTEQQVAEIKRLMKDLKDMYFVLMPTIVVTCCLFWSYLCFMAGKGIFALFRKDVSGFSRFCDFKMQTSALLVAAVAYIASIFFDAGKLGYAFGNFSSIIFTVTSFCGLSMVDFWLRKKIRFSALRFLLYVVLSVFMGIGFSLIFFIGIADAIFDLRNPGKINRNNNE